MNRIHYNQASSTVGSVVIMGLLAYQLNGVEGLPNTDPADKRLLQHYSFEGDRFAFNSYGNLITNGHELTSSSLEQSVGKFYAQLLANQEPLGAEFERVLYDNLWDLYES